MCSWPTTAAQLEALQRALADRARTQPTWRPATDVPLGVGGVFVATPRGASGAGAAGDPAVVAAVIVIDGRIVERVVIAEVLDAAYTPGLLALREGRTLASAIQQLRQRPEVVLVNASGRDHPRRAGLALHVGAALGLPSIGVTDRPLLAEAAEPGRERGAATELRLDGEVVGYRLRTRTGARPVVVHAGWLVDAETACAMVLQMSGESRTPQPLREARRLARTARAGRSSSADR